MAKSHPLHEFRVQDLVPPWQADHGAHSDETIAELLRSWNWLELCQSQPVGTEYDGVRRSTEKTKCIDCSDFFGWSYGWKICDSTLFTNRFVYKRITNLKLQPALANSRNDLPDFAGLGDFEQCSCICSFATAKGLQSQLMVWPVSALIGEEHGAIGGNCDLGICLLELSSTGKDLQRCSDGGSGAKLQSRDIRHILMEYEAIGPIQISIFLVWWSL